jgi:hypothetical protein
MKAKTKTSNAAASKKSKPKTAAALRDLPARKNPRAGAGNSKIEQAAK